MRSIASELKKMQVVTYGNHQPKYESHKTDTIAKVINVFHGRTVKAQQVPTDTVIPLLVPRLRASAARRPGSVHGAGYNCMRESEIYSLRLETACVSFSLSLSVCARACM